MRNKYSRHLAHLLRHEKASDKTVSFVFTSKTQETLTAAEEVVIPDIPPEFNAKDWMTCLIHIDAELEHGLMVQYLYAAYSMGGDQVEEKDRELVRCWQEIILGIAKEEMGHFVSVQNVLRVIGAPLNFRRQDFPWDSELYPFEFMLEPFSLTSLAKYVFAESPVGWLNSKSEDQEMNDIKKEIRAVLSKVDHGDPVGKIFDQILAIIKDPELINDDVFLPDTYPFQAKFDEWGRGYEGGARGNSTKGNAQGAPDVLVAPLLSRTDAIEALKEIAEQGESTSEKDNELSHFERFLSIYKELRKMPKSFQPSRNIAVNPTIGDAKYDHSSSPSGGLVSDQEIDVITNPLAQKWANLFNVRYRMLLSFLTHSFLLDQGANSSGASSARGTIIHATFGEMYNLRSISNVLVKLPLGDNSDKMAGPPFLIPYSMDLPTSEVSRWRLHQGLLQTSAQLIDSLVETVIGSEDESNLTYLYSLKEADKKLNELATKITAVTK